MKQTPSAANDVFYDLPLLRRLTAALDEVDPDGPPVWRRVVPNGAPQPRRLGLLAGSFNPPTMAHLALAGAALATGRLDEVALAVSKVTVDKETVTRASLPDRLLLLSLIVGRLNDEAVASPTRRPHDSVTMGLSSVALLNRGLYAGQAQAVRAALPDLTDLSFIVGFDKIVQILDPRYYDDRDAALDGLFAATSFLVASRAGQDAADLDALFARPENRRYRARVAHLPLSPVFAAHSSSAVRAGHLDLDALASYIPGEAAAFLAEARPYDLPQYRPGGAVVDRYGIRLTLLQRLLAEGSDRSPREVRALYAQALAAAGG